MTELPRSSQVGKVFWGSLLAIFLLCGSALISFKIWPPTAAGIYAAFVTWLCAVAFLALLLRGVSKAHDLLRALGAMWRPVVLVLAAAWLLFVNDQGRDLGVSLMGENQPWRIGFLFLALVYWATNNWHTARLGLNGAVASGALPHPTGDERWLYWPPRLLGVCAHLFAAINLSLAAWALPEAAWGDDLLRWLAWTAPLAIILATAIVWTVDYLMFSQRSERDLALLARWLLWGAVIGETLLLGGLVIIAFRRTVPHGFVPATIAISGSAFVFLFLISWLRRKKPIGAIATEKMRNEDELRERREIVSFTIGLFAVAVAVAAAVWFSPTHIGRFFGSMVVAYFAFGAVLAAVNFFELAVDFAVEKQIFGAGANKRVVLGYTIAFVLVLGLANAVLRPFHRVRLCDGQNCVVSRTPPEFSFVASPQDRMTVQEAAQAWYEQARTAYGELHAGEPVPMVIVATAGGGIRAAYWTATVLEKLEKDLEPSGGLSPYLFAISGVSGGSVGAAVYSASLAARAEGLKPHATEFLADDFLAPALATWIFVDAPSQILPDFGQGDRGVALEQSFEHASKGFLARPFLSFFPDRATTSKTWRPILLLNGTHEETGRRIIAGHVKIERDVFVDSLDELHMLGSDVRASTAAHNSARFTYVSPAGDLGRGSGSVIDGGYFENYGALSALELARAARVALKDKSPGVKLVILMISSDPGLDETRTLVRIKEAQKGGKCLLSNAEREHPPTPPGEASTDAKRVGDPANYLSLDPVQVENAYINEFSAPFQGLVHVREAHGTRAAAELAAEICAEFDDLLKPAVTNSSGAPSPQARLAKTFANSKEMLVTQSTPVTATLQAPYFAHMAMCRAHKDGAPLPVQAPLGWVLSESTREAFVPLLHECGNKQELEQLEVSLGKAMETTDRSH
ncbi:hypothetical protein MCBRY_002152 [Methylocystis bryophila]|uniref:PNPLA domain-containing protein n=1 Tax=Methylocystis bryophila TaxID=655015 RepID=A0A1W6MTQ1_9HYPH|nr:hypothetical protein B1812_07735 [Methylocystis bryophila]